MAAQGLRLSQPRLDRGILYWLERRPLEKGRGVLMSCSIAHPASPEERTPAGRSVRSRLYEYGGGDYVVRGGCLCAVDDEEGTIFQLAPGGWRRVPGCLSGARYGDLELSPDATWLVAVEEQPVEGAEARHRLVALSLLGGERRVIAAQHDFVSSPCFAPDGARVAYLTWDHPNMPWDGTRLWVVPWKPDGIAGPPRALAGGRDESIFQPRFSPDGEAVFASDRSGFWNLYALRNGRVVALCRRALEFGRPRGVAGLSTYDFVDHRALLAAVTERGVDRLVRLNLAAGTLEELRLPFSALEGVSVEERYACFLGASAERASSLWLLDLQHGSLREVRSTQAEELEAGFLSHPEPLEFPSSEGRIAHAFFYRPRHPSYPRASGRPPPLLVRCHGGPTSAAIPAFDLAVQYWTSRGFAVVEVNYVGSSGYGRAYRERLDGSWGVADVDDCLAAARFLGNESAIDSERMAVHGSSAGGYTALCMLTFREGMRAAAVYYGVADLESFARDAHKFEAHYHERLVGPYPEQRALYRERSPLHAAARFGKPLIWFQGLEDRVVPPSQAEAFIAALRRRGIPHAYLSFPKEGHGFRLAESVERALDAELRFFARLFELPVQAPSELPLE